MKKTLAIILALILSLSVFAGVTVFADGMYSPHYLSFILAGYKYNMPAENIVAEIYELGYLASETRYHLENSDGVVAEGNIEAGVDYKLVFEMKLRDTVTLDNLTKERADLSVHEKATIEECINVIPYGRATACDIYKDGEWDVVVFELPQLKSRFDSIEFFIDGYELGARADEVVISSGTDGVYDCKAYFFTDKTVLPMPQEEGAFKTGIGYHMTLWFKVPEGASPFGMDSDKITLRGVGDEVFESMGMMFFENTGSYITSFDLPALEGGEVPIMSLGFTFDGYYVGAGVDEIVINTNDNRVTVTDVKLGKREGLNEITEYVEEVAPSTYYFMLVTIKATDGYFVPSDVSLYNYTFNGVRSWDCFESEGGVTFVRALPIATEKPTVEDEKLLGDMDGDGEITVSDALRALRIAAGLDVATATKGTRSAILGDVDGDGAVTVADALSILRKAAKLA